MATPQPELAATNETAAAPTQAQVVGRIAAQLADESLASGARAELRRLDPRGSLAEPALQRLFARHVPEEWLRGNGERAWALLIHGLALASPDRHRARERLGAALQAAGWKEGRLAKLLDATFDGLFDQVPRAVRFLVAKGQAVNGLEFADLIFSRVRDEAWADRVRRRIASDYYRAEFRAERPAGTSTETFGD